MGLACGTGRVRTLPQCPQQTLAGPQGDLEPALGRYLVGEHGEELEQIDPVAVGFTGGVCLGFHTSIVWNLGCYVK